MKLSETGYITESSPKAIIVVHLYGMLKMNEILKVSRRYNIPIIEDAAEGNKPTYFNKPLGSLAEFGVYSFNGNKIITTSGGENSNFFRRRFY